MVERISGFGTAALREYLRGAAYEPGDSGYDEARTAWNLSSVQSPALVVVAECAEDVQAAVRYTGERGHGVGAACDGDVLINTSRMRGVVVDPEARTATVEAGALWKDVIPQVQEHGLAGLVGSASHVGVVVYTMGGGFGWLVALKDEYDPANLFRFHRNVKPSVGR